MNLRPLDWIIVAVPVLLVGGMAVFAQRLVRDVSGFLAAGRSAGRYLICNAEGTAAMGAITIVGMFEQLYNGGPAVGFWAAIATPLWILVSLSGFIIYRYRETRVLTMAQFFEIRYSKKFRVFMGLVAFLSGIINFGIFPAVGARFIVSYSGLPDVVTLGAMSVPTYALVMAVLLSVNLAFATMGGQLTAMVTDCIEGIFSGVFFLIVVSAALWVVGLGTIREALNDRPAGQSFLNPFDTFQIQDFNIWFVLIGLFTGVYNYMAWQGNQGFNASALNAHEARMGRVLGQLRTYSRSAMIIILGLCAYAFMHHPDHAGGAAIIGSKIAGIGGGEMIQREMTVPMTLSHVLPVGIKGMFLAIVIFSIMATDTSYMHSWGSVFIQDVVLPFRRSHLSPEAHIRLLRWSIAGVAAFSFLFSLLFRQSDYIFMYFAITGAIYLGGAGSAIIGGLYWKRGTAAGAWSAMFVGSGLSVAGIVVRQVNPAFPLNGQLLCFIATLAAIGVYIVVSLVTCRRPHDMEKLLHRGRHSVKEQESPVPEVTSGWRNWPSLIGINGEFTRGDRIQAVIIFGWSIALFGIFGGALVWNTFSRWNTEWWWNYLLITVIIVPLGVGVITAAWFGWGGIRDLLQVFRRLGKARLNPLDDGEIVQEAGSKAP
jgi:SSS family solute:Na+ symporter